MFLDCGGAFEGAAFDADFEAVDEEGGLVQGTVFESVEHGFFASFLAETIRIKVVQSNGTKDK